ncbi:helix-turn-helix domain-containing protein [Psychrobacillus antarcticus]|uniref:helix-turn-helix domain-containing protein n=1 Tax=Psychrobacillus antarcticus TaxID=2879115 RepID=UPI0024081B92|nr:transcriptional regulator [Psychrobacillus antarcticus]
MKIGPLIKYYRTMQKMTQGKLCAGICSSAHLSKIENNTREGNAETNRLLLERLKIDISEVENGERNIRHLLEEFVSHLQYCELEKLSSAYVQLENYKDLIAFTDYMYLYELYKFRYYLTVKELKSAEEQLKWLQGQIQNFSKDEECLLSYFNSILLISRGNYAKADKILMEIIQVNSSLGIFEGEAFYYVAVVKGYLTQSNEAIVYGEKALEHFKAQLNFSRILNTLFSLSMNYSQVKIYDKALETYGHLLRNAEIFNCSSLLPQVYHNIGDLHYIMENYSIARAYFKKSLTKIPRDTENFLLCVFNLGQTEYQLEKWDTSRENFKLLKQDANRIESVHFDMYANFYLLLLDHTKKKAMAYLEEKLLPFTSLNERYTVAHKLFSNMLSDFYKEEGKFDKAVQFQIL